MKLTTFATALISAGVASIITAYAVEKKIMKDYDERLERELEASVVFLEKMEKAEPTEEYQEKRVGKTFDITKPSIDEVVQNNQRIRYDNVLKGEGYSAPEPDFEEVVVETCDTLGELFTITTEEFMNNESGYLQSSLSYFADGGVLDEDGDLVIDFEDMIGHGPPPFGDQSGEPHIVYMRNTKIQREFEVIRDEANAADVLAVPGTET